MRINGKVLLSNCNTIWYNDEMKRKIRQMLCMMLAMVCLSELAITTHAITISELQQQQKQNQEKLNSVNDKLDSIESEQEILEEEIADLDAELINIMTTIEVLEDDITQKTADIEVARGQYEEAKATEEAQYEAMKVRMKYMYEQGDDSYLEILFGAKSLSDLVNRADYTEKLYTYDRKLLEEYVATKNEIADLQALLEEQKAELEEDKVELVAQQTYLDEILTEKKAQSDDYEAQIAAAKAQANKLKKAIAEEARQIKKIQDEEARKKAAATAANGNYSVKAFDTSIISGANGSELGKKIAMYGCQFIGNPYVAGGTSLTQGADCSGFVYRIYSDFGYKVPRNSFSLRSAGTEVAYANAQPGDVICYSGHVALYVGGGYIVHASTQRTGIKISKANYKPMICVRRII